MEFMSGWFQNAILGPRPVLINCVYFGTISPALEIQIKEKNLTNQLVEIPRNKRKSVLYKHFSLFFKLLIYSDS
jgi:hypothetical protein